MTGMIAALAFLVGVILGLGFFPFLVYVVGSMADKPKTQADAEQVVADAVTREKARLWDKLEAIMESNGGVVEVAIAYSDGGLYWVNADGPWEPIERSSPTLAGAVIGAHYELTKEVDA